MITGACHPSPLTSRLSMNTNSTFSLNHCFRSVSAGAAKAGLAACLCALAVPSTGHAESIEALRGLNPMNSAELEESYGGFILPGGMNINIGIETDISVALPDGKFVVRNYYSTGKIHAPKTTADVPTVSATVEKLANTNQYRVAPTGSSTSVATIERPDAGTSPSGNTSVSSVVNPLTGFPTTVIINSTNQAIISQVQRITIDITNLAVTKLQASGALATLKSQALNGLRNVFR